MEGIYLPVRGSLSGCLGLHGHDPNTLPTMHILLAPRSGFSFGSFFPI